MGSDPKEEIPPFWPLEVMYPGLDLGVEPKVVAPGSEIEVLSSEDVGARPCGMNEFEAFFIWSAVLSIPLAWSVKGLPPMSERLCIFE